MEGYIFCSSQKVKEEERNPKKSGDDHNQKQSHACLMPAMADTNGSGDKSMPQP